MKNRRIIVISALLVIVTLGLLLVLIGFQQQRLEPPVAAGIDPDSPAAVDVTSPDNTIAEQEIGQTSGALAQAESDAFSPSPQFISSEFKKADSASAAFESIELAFDSGNVNLGLWMEQELAGDCGGIQGWNDPLHEKTRWAWEQLQQHCADYDPYMIQRSVDYMQAGNSPIQMKITAKLRSNIDKLSFEDRQDYLLDYLANSEAPYNFQAVANIVREISETDSQFPVYLGQGPDIPVHELAEIQSSALLLAECRKFGGCGPESVRLLNVCFLSGKCDQGWNMEDYFYNNLSPAQYEQVLKIVHFVLAKNKK